MTPTLTIAEVLDAVAKANEPDEDTPPNTYPLWQIQEALKVGGPKMNALLRGWLASGEVKLVRYRKRALDGRLMSLKGFQFAVPLKSKKRTK